VSLVVPALITAGIVFYPEVLRIARLLGIAGDCGVFVRYGILCPTCGTTRAVTALVRGEVSESLRLNLSVVFALLLGLGFYAETVLRVFGRQVRIIPRSAMFLWVVLGVFGTYFVLRNFIGGLMP
jgi:hypothetical protein